MGAKGHNLDPRIIIITKTADQIVNNSTSLVNDTELKYVLKPNPRYYFEINALVLSQSAADIDVTFAVLAGSPYTHFVTGWALGNPTSFTTRKSFATNATTQILSLLGSFKTGPDGGTLQFQWAQDVADATDTKVLEGSVLRIHELE